MDPTMTFTAPISAQVAVPGIHAHSSTFSFNVNSGTPRSKLGRPNMEFN